MASLLAADQPVKALVLLSYPLHRPGHPNDLRTEHWPRIDCPVLLLSGDRDPFAKVDLLRDEVRRLRPPNWSSTRVSATDCSRFAKRPPRGSRRS